MAAPVQETRQEGQEETRQMRRPADPGRGSRAVLWTGVMLGTTVLVLAWRHGIHLRLPGPALLAGFGGFLLEWLALTGLAMWAAHLVRRHHRTMIGYTVRKARQHTVSAARGAGMLTRQAHRWAAPRWEGRGESWRTPLTVTRRRLLPSEEIEQLDQAEPCPTCGAGVGEPCAPGCDDRQRPAAGSGTHGEAFAAPTAAGAPAPAANPNGGTMAPPARTERPPAAPRTTAGPAPGAWNALVSDTHDFEAGDDGQLLEWMADQTTGMLRYGEAVADVHEHHVSAAVRLDPAAMAALRDVADAVADAAEAMARAREKFREVYEAPREFVGAGGVLPKDGDFLTGEDES